MTKMKRTTVSFPDRIVEALEELKKTEEFQKCSDSEIVRRMVQMGLDVMERDST